MHLVIKKVKFMKKILLKLIVYYLVKLKCYFLGSLKNNCILKQN